MADFGRSKTWTAETLTSSDLNAEFDNIITNVTSGGINSANIDETDAYTWSGAHSFSAAVTHTNTVTVGVDDTGHDVKFFGATSGKSWLWDESADKMIVTGDAAVGGEFSVTGNNWIIGNSTTVDYFGNMFQGTLTSGGAAALAAGSVFGVDLTGATGDTAFLTNVGIGGSSFGGSITTQGATETISVVSSLYLAEPGITVGSGDTVTLGTTLYVGGAPTEGTDNYAAYFNADAAINGDLRLTGNGWIQSNGTVVDYIANLFQGSYSSGGAANYVIGTAFGLDITGVTGDTSYITQMGVGGSSFGGSITTQSAAETLNIATSLFVAEPNITVSGSCTVTDATSFYVGGAPTEGTNNYAAYINGSTYVSSGNLLLGTSAAGTSASGVLAIGNGTQGAALANAIQIVSEDLSAGNTIPSIRTEGGGIYSAGTPAAATGSIAMKIDGTVYYFTVSTTAAS